MTDGSKAVVGKFHRSTKETLTIRLDADVLCWLKGGGRGYQTRINAILRNAMEGTVVDQTPAERPRGTASRRHAL